MIFEFLRAYDLLYVHNESNLCQLRNLRYLQPGNACKLSQNG